MKKFTFNTIASRPFKYLKKKSGDIIHLHMFFEEDLGSLKAHKFLGKKQIVSVQSVVKKGFFEGQLNQFLTLPDCSCILIGLGKKKNFHPDHVAKTFRHLTTHVSNYKKIHLSIIISSSLVDVVSTYNKKYLESQKSKVTIKNHINADSKKKAASDSQSFDSSYTLDDMISQMSSCMVIGSHKPELLRSQIDKKGSLKKKLECTFEFLNTTSSPIKRASVTSGLLIGDLVNRSRHLANLPGNYLNPKTYEKYARQLAKEFALKIRVFSAKELEKRGFGGIISVGQGSSVPPCMIALEYKPKNAVNKKPVVLVGKGVTFDTGGISLKPSPEMHEMKFDMCGSALALHSIALASSQKSRVHTVCLIGLAENMPDGHAIKPGDVYTAYNKKTVEVQNTDAEGRLVLGDVLAYACEKYKPALIMDFATLTGACVVALGHHATGVMTSSQPLYESIEKASRVSLDKIWRLPHWEIYGSELRSSISDLRNIGSRPAGTISAMRFLSEFVDEDIPWAHFDIAGTAWRAKEQGSQPAGATGWGLRLMSQLYKEFY